MLNAVMWPLSTPIAKVLLASSRSEIRYPLYDLNTCESRALNYAGPNNLGMQKSSLGHNPLIRTCATKPKTMKHFWIKYNIYS